LGTLRTSVDMLAGTLEVGGSDRTATWKLDEVELLTLLRAGDVCRNEWVHERLEVGPPPLCQCVADLPLVVDALTCELGADGRKTLVEPRLETLDLVVFGAEIVARAALGQPCLHVGEGSIQLEEGVRDLQHEDMWVVVLVADQDAFASPSHAMLRVVFFQSLQSRKDRRVLFWLAIFGSECVVAQGEQANRLGLVAVEVLGNHGAAYVR